MDIYHECAGKNIRIGFAIDRGESVNFEPDSGLINGSE